MAYYNKNSDVTSLKLCNLIHFNIRIDEYLICFPNVRDLSILNSEITFRNCFQIENQIEVSCKNIFIFSFVD